jgi:hypothetical protein
MNISITNAQYKLLNKMIEFIDGSNYHGDLYRQYRERQIELSKYWLSTFVETDKKGTVKLIEQAEKEELNHLAKMNKKYVKTDKMDKTSSKTVPVKTAPSKKMSRARSKSKSKSKPKSKAKAKAKPKAKPRSKSKPKPKSAAI